MKRILLLTTMFCLVGASVLAEYKIQLKNGKIITAEEKPVIKKDLAFFTKEGLTLYLPANQVDLEASQKLNTLKATPDMQGVVPASVLPPEKPQPLVITDEMLNKITAHSRLANEGELTSPANGETSSAEEGPKPAPREDRQAAEAAHAQRARQELQNRLNSLMSDRFTAQRQQADLSKQVQELQQKFNFSTQYDDKQRIQAQIDQAQSQLNSVRDQLSGLDSQIQSVQEQISAVPPTVVIEGNK
ncbi:MAG: hypothetical protein ACP5VF_09470 [Acidobacteriota bacterium]